MIIFIGTYTDGGDFFPTVCGDGIMNCRMDEESGIFSRLHCCADVVNPSWVHLADGGKRLFAVSETFDQPGNVHGFDVEPEGRLKHVSSQSSHGLATCHLSSTDKHLYVASYLDGRLSVCPRQGARIRESIDLIEYSGSGPVADRQEAAHAHQAVVSPDGRWLYVCDLGSDCIRQHELRGGVPVYTRDIEVAPGAGPRHLAFHPDKPQAWAVCELTPLILTFAWSKDTGELQLLQTFELANFPKMAGVGAAAAIHLHSSGNLLGVSDRASHSICLFTVAETGDLDFQQRIRNEDEIPRDFAFTPDRRWLIAAYQDSNRLASHAIDDALHVASVPADCLEVNSPVCVAIEY